MIEPYRDAIERNRKSLDLLGFRDEYDSDYSTSLVNDGFHLKIDTERYYHPSVSMALLDKSGNEFELGLLEKTLDPDRLRRDREACRIFEKEFADNPSANKSVFMEEYAAMCIAQALEFMIAWRDTIFPDTSTFRGEYQRHERNFLRRFGILPE